jgi:cytochrome c-type biogenesis protein
VIEAIFAWIQQLYSALQSTQQIAPWVYALILAGGIASAISPCYTPVLAMFGGYIGGYAHRHKSTGLLLALFFVLGNAMTLAAVGGVASLAGKSTLQVFYGYQLDRWIPGVIGLFMGLQLLGLLRLKMPTMPIFRCARRPGTGMSSFLLGLPFGLVVTPCTMPIFFAIVAFVAFQQSVTHGALLMVVYALGRGIILIAVAVSVDVLKSLNVGRTSAYVERFSGVLILFASVGLLLFYESFVRFTMQWMSTTQ